MGKITVTPGVNRLNESFECIERKGMGHPDTLADALAEELSRKYASLTRERIGCVLHHNFDKTGLLGGASHVEFGNGYLKKPIRILINGRASMKFGGEDLGVKNHLEAWAVEFLIRQFPQLRREIDLEIHFNLSTASSPGAFESKDEKNPRNVWFEPKSLDDLPERKRLHSNDTSLGVGYAPLSDLEVSILDIERTLNSPEFKSQHPWIGSDIKLMGTVMDGVAGLTMCIPQIANHVTSLDEYRQNLETAKGVVLAKLKTRFSNISGLSINTRDNFNTNELYLTAIGSSIESGDEGLVGRGNRINGLISPNRPMSMEGACGKNPVYHIGKLYNIAAQRIANLVHEKTGEYCEVFLVSQSGRGLIDPWKIVISVPHPEIITPELRDAIMEEIIGIPKITGMLLAGEIPLY